MLPNTKIHATSARRPLHHCGRAVTRGHRAKLHRERRFRYGPQRLATIRFTASGMVGTGLQRHRHIRFGPDRKRFCGCRRTTLSANTVRYPTSGNVRPFGARLYRTCADQRTAGAFLCNPQRANCTGGGGGGGGQFLTQIGVWQLQTAPVRLVGLGTSVEILLGIEKDAAGGSLQGYLDAVLFADHLFADGFEGP
jgi:hypothetical protein